MKPNYRASRHNPAAHGGVFSVPDAPKGVLDFSSSINPLGLQPQVKAAIRENLGLLQVYPDSESRLLRESLESYAGVHASQIVVGNGATEIIYNFCRAYLSRTTRVLIPAPTFGEYETAAKLAGARITPFNTMNLKRDLPEFLSMIPRNGCVFLCNPNNPTGTILPKKDVKKIILESEKNDTLVFADECFIELVPGGDRSIIRLVKFHENLTVLRSFTKSFAFAGMRLGYCASSKQAASILNKIKIPWNVSGMAQKAACAALDNLSYLEKARALIGREAGFLNRSISKLAGFECHGTVTNFILVKTEEDSTTVQKRLLEKKILVRDCKSFRGLEGNHIRIAVRGRRENKKLIEALAEL